MYFGHFGHDGGIIRFLAHIAFALVSYCHYMLLSVFITKMTSISHLRTKMRVIYFSGSSS